MHLSGRKMRVLKIFKKSITCFLLFCLCSHFNIQAQIQSIVTTNNQTQDWIFGDGPEPKWVVELLHGAYQNVKEDNSFILKVPIAGSGINYSASVDGNAEIKQDGDYLIITPEKDYHGTILVNLNLDMSFILNVQSVNDKPSLSTTDNKTIKEDEIFSLELSAQDVEGDELTYGASADNGATAKIIKNNLTITPEKNYYGPININLAVSDGKSTDESSFILNVEPINDAPVLESILSKTMENRNYVDLLMSGSDIDGDKLTYSVTGGDNVDFDVENNKIVVKPKKNYRGATAINLTTSDGKSSVDTSFTLINPLPGLSAFAPQSMLEDEILTIVLNTRDVELDPFRYRVRKTENANIEINDNELSIIPDKDYFGELILNLNISDGEDSTDFSFNINVLPQPDFPIAYAGNDTTISNGCNSSLLLDGSKSYDADNDIASYKWTLLSDSSTILNGKKGIYKFKNSKKDLYQKILLTVSDSKGLKAYDTINVTIISDTPPLANAGDDFIAPFDKFVRLDGSRSVDDDSEIIYFWSIVSGDVSFSKIERIKREPVFEYPSEITKPKNFIALLKVQDENSFCFSVDTVLITCLPNVDMADSTVKYEIVRASKKDNRVFIDLNVTNKQFWPFDFAAFTLISVKNEDDKLGQIDPYKGRNTVKYGIENEEKVGVELVYNFDSPPQEVSIVCKSNMALTADTVLFKQSF